DPVEHLAQRFGVDIAHYGNFQRVLREHPLAVLFQIITSDRRQALLGANRGPAIRVVRESSSEPLTCSNPIGVLGSESEAGEQLPANALHRVGVEAWLVDGEP